MLLPTWPRRSSVHSVLAADIWVRNAFFFFFWPGEKCNYQQPQSIHHPQQLQPPSWGSSNWKLVSAPNKCLGQSRPILSSPSRRHEKTPGQPDLSITFKISTGPFFSFFFFVHSGLSSFALLPLDFGWGALKPPMSSSHSHSHSHMYSPTFVIL